MKIRDLRLVGIRCFGDTSDITLHPHCNIFVGKNNAGKSTLLKAILGFQGFPFDQLDIRPGHEDSSFVTVAFNGVLPTDQFAIGRTSSLGSLRFTSIFRGNPPTYSDAGTETQIVSAGQTVIFPNRPHYQIVPFLARRKAVSFDHNVSLGPQNQLTGTMSSLYGRIDLLATYGHPDHDRFREAVSEVVGLPITMKASQGGKEAGFYFDRDTFVTLERMGDGVSEMVSLIVELCTERNKIFVLEEPETNLHPQGLKALLAMIRTASEQNQFIIATHSNVVVRELGGKGDGKVFRVFRDGESHTSPSKVEEVPRTPTAHMELLRELGYEFADFDLFDAWLFLEESSAERVIRDILIPSFAPNLLGRLRTFSAGGASNLEPSLSEFKRLVVFVHLQPVYSDRIWVRADGDKAGKEAIANLRAAFSYLTKDAADTFKKPQFEHYYPPLFREKADTILAIVDKNLKRKQKAELLQEVLDWTAANNGPAIKAWANSAKEPIKLLQSIEAKLIAA
jgi:AAA domain, putative AbiEii toxin, Type IV TA system/AAA domain